MCKPNWILNVVSDVLFSFHNQLFYSKPNIAIVTIIGNVIIIIHTLAAYVELKCTILQIIEFFQSSFSRNNDNESVFLSIDYQQLSPV